MENELKVLSLLSPQESEIADGLEGLLDGLKSSRRIQLRVIRKVHPSAFLHMDFVDDEALKEAYLAGVIDLCLAVDRVKGHLMCALLDRTKAQSNDVAKLLGCFQIPIVFFDSQTPSDKITEEVRHALSAEKIKERSLVAGTTGMANSAEEWIFKLLSTWQDGVNGHASSGLKKTDQFSFCQEASLCAFLSYPDQADRKLLEYWCTSRVDLLILSPGPECRPLLVIEMDGPYHLKPSVQRKDKMKEQLLSWAGIPMIRVCLSDMPYRLDRTDNVLIDFLNAKKEKIDRRLYENIVRVLVSFSGMTLDFAAQTNEEHRLLEEKKLQAFRAKVRAERKLTSRIALPLDSAMRLLEEAEEELIDESSAVYASERGSEFLLGTFFDEQIEICEKQLAERQCSITEFDFQGVGKTAVAEAKLVTAQNTYPISIPRPTFRFVWDLPEIAPSFVEAMEAAIYLVMVEFAVDMLDDLNVKQNLA